MRHLHGPIATHGHDDHHGEHAHHHMHKHAERSRLLASLALTGAMMVAELIGGLLTNSLALVSDAGHMATHFVALAVTYFAILIAARPAPAGRTYGLYRTEILAAFVNGLLLLGATAYILYESAVRLIQPVPIATTEMLIVAVAGLVVNFVSVLLLAGVGKQDLNVRSAFLHMIGDTLSSVAVVGGAVLMHFTGWLRVDPILSALIAVLIGIWSVGLLRDSANVLLESTPKHVDIAALVNALRAASPEVRDLHDIHVWEITSAMYAMTAHVTLDAATTVAQAQDVRQRLEACARDQFRIGHTIFQFEGADASCDHVEPYGASHAVTDE
ncbi:MAG: cation transporter [Planctomycetes bacterium]|nr:cation transporter [Planctomycetota bacterium]